MNINLNKIKNWLQKTLIVVKKKRRLIISLIFLLLLGHSTYQWYRYVYKFGWSNEKKQEYISSREKLATFDDSKFKEITQEIYQRKIKREKKIENVPNIFRLK